jgi:hypothetical protein
MGAAMNHRKRVLVGLILIAGLSLVGFVLAAPLDADLVRYVIGSGGGYLESGPYSLGGTIGQALAGVDFSASLDLCAGFWCGEGVGSRHLYLPLIQR